MTATLLMSRLPCVSGYHASWAEFTASMRDVMLKKLLYVVRDLIWPRLPIHL